MDAKDVNSNLQTGTWEMYKEYINVINFFTEEDFSSAFMFVEEDMIDIDKEFNFILDNNKQVKKIKKE